MSRRGALIATIAVVLSGVMGWAAAGIAAGNVLTVSQRDRSFKPNKLEVSVGDVIRVVNDDGELVHHAYIDAASFKFDSGEQTPGSHTDISIPTPGTYNVLCLIHPKMRLAVTVK